MPDSPTSKTESDFVCACEKWMRDACAREPFYREHEGKRYCVLHFRGKEKSADFKAALERKLENKDFDFRGVWFPDEVSFSGFDFSAATNFSGATFSAYADFSYKTFSAGAHFNFATFSAAAHFVHTTFSAEAKFGNATFSAEAKFRNAHFSAEADFACGAFSAAADFSSATFSAGGSFESATFSAEATFSSATFSGEANFLLSTFIGQADFSEAAFSARADFGAATFGTSANFRFATFSEVAYFNYATFRGYVEFSGDENKQVFSVTSSLTLQFAKIEKLDNVSFHTLTLHPHWFINIDPRKFDFTNVKWENSGKARPELNLLKTKPTRYTQLLELLKTNLYVDDQALIPRGDRVAYKSPNRLLSQACQRLAANSEENSQYRSASHFRRMALDAERLETWRGFDFRRLNWWYWVASGYGERPFQALMVLVGVLVLFGLLYTQVGFARWEPRLASEADAVVARKDDVGAPLKFTRALTYSASVLTFQRPEPKPATTAAQTLVLFETILGPVQAALLALAIRRKFMR